MAGPIPPLQTTRRRFTNEGIPLVSEWLGGESDTIREIPPEWRAALDLVVTEQPVPTDRELFQLTDEILACKAEQKQTSERTMRTIRKPAGVFTLLERFTNKDKEFGTRSRSFHFENDFGSVPAPSATTDVNTKNFGNKHFEQVIETIPGVFDAEEFSVERPVVTPEDFRALLQEHEHSITEEGDAAEPTLVAGDVKRTDTQQDLFLHRESRTYIDLSSLPRFFINQETNQDKQVVQVTRFLLDDSTTPAVPTSTRDVSFTKLGDGTALEIVKDIDEIFPAQVYGQERGIVTPEDFRALLQTSNNAVTSEGIASDPGALSAGQISITDTQVDVFNHRVDTREIDLLTLPKTIHNYETNQFKQVVDVFRTLDLDSVGPASVTALQDVTWTKLGDGTALQIRHIIDEVFDRKQTSTEIPDLLPDIFKAALPAYTHETVEIGSSVTDPPVLDAGDFFKSETRETELTRKIVTRGRAGLSLPQSVVVLRKTTEEFGGAIVKLTGFLDDSEPSVETGLDVVSSEVRNLGNSTWFRQTEKLDTDLAWPTLYGSYFDKEMQVRVDEEEQVVDAGYSPVDIVGVSTERVKPIDFVRSKRFKTSKVPTADSLANAIVEEVDGPFQFPGIAYLAPSGLGYYRRQSSAQICQHILRTWWLQSATKPTRGLPGSSSDVEVQDIVMDDIIISTLNNTSTLDYSGMCLHDAITTFGTFVYAATVPSATAYLALIGSEIVVGASIETTDIPQLWKIQTKSVVAR